MAAGERVKRSDGEVPVKIGLDIARALQPTAIAALRQVAVRRLRRVPVFAGAPAGVRSRLERAILAGDAVEARGALVEILGVEVARTLLDQDPRRETATDAALSPADRRRMEPHRPVSITPQPPPAPTVAGGGERSSTRLVDHETVLSVGSSIVGRGRHERPRGDIQRWVADTSADPHRILELPPLEPGDPRTWRWRTRIAAGELVCPWPACPDARMILRAGEERAPHVAHRPGVGSHGTTTDWVLSTLHAVATLAGAVPVNVLADPPVVRLDGAVLAFLPYRLGLRLVDAVERARRALDPGEPVIGILDADRLPRRAVPVRVAGEQQARWAIQSVRRETLRALERFDHVLALPSRRTEGSAAPEDARWGSDWLGVGRERSPALRRLDWSALGRRPSPLVMVRLNDRAVRRVLARQATR